MRSPSREIAFTSTPTTPRKKLKDSQFQPFSSSNLSPLLLKAKQRTPTKTRIISHSPYQVISIPEVYNFYEYSPLDWSSKDVVASACYNCIYMVQPSDKKSTIQMDFDFITSSLRFSPDGYILALGTKNEGLKLFDASKQTITTSATLPHTTCYTIDSSESLFVYGLNEGEVYLFDTREGENVDEFSVDGHGYVKVLFSPNRRYIAGASRDGAVYIWDVRNSSEPLTIYDEHQSCCKALAFCEGSSRIASGGGTKDTMIRVWNINTGETQGSVLTGNQVCNLFWNSDYKEIVSMHGFDTYGVCFWNAQDLTPITSFRGHTSRVLYAALSSDKSRCVTSTPTDPLSFFNFFPASRKDRDNLSSEKVR